tara:strand:+ start:93 stop:509 length:417 start_codon:yes stop_codon:yes gene_type:complete
MKNVLILCTGNSCRSQMAQGWLSFLLREKVNVYSAGTHPEPVNPFAIEAMNDVGIDISYYESNKIDDYMGINFDFIITVCDNAREICPYFPSHAKKIHHSFLDPANATGTYSDQLKVYIDVRDKIKEYLQKFCEDYFF